MSSTQILRSVLQRPTQSLSDLELIPVFRPASPPRVILVTLWQYFTLLRKYVSREQQQLLSKIKLRGDVRKYLSLSRQVPPDLLEHLEDFLVRGDLTGPN